MELIDSFGDDTKSEIGDFSFVNEFLADAISTSKINRETECCGQEMNVENENRLICKICSKTKDIVIDITGEDIGTTIYMRVEGQSARKQRYIFTANKEQYKKIRYDYMLARIKDMNNLSKTIKLNNEIMSNARDICIEILDKQTYRNEVLKEIIAMSINVTCIDNGIYYKESCIAKFVGLKLHSFPTGHSIISNAIADKKLKHYVNLNITSFHYAVTSYFNQFECLDSKYIDLVVELCEITLKKNIMTHYIMSSKVIGTIWCMINLLGLPISEENFEFSSNSKKATFKKYFLEMKQYKRIFNVILQPHGLTL
jgi:hypothetical protein